jgi:hypothetical protein
MRLRSGGRFETVLFVLCAAAIALGTGGLP